jgi:hypothetical protein
VIWVAVTSGGSVDTRKRLVPAPAISIVTFDISPFS